MKILKKLLIVIITIIICSMNMCSYAKELIEYLEKPEYSEEFNEWLELPDEEKDKVIMPPINKTIKTVPQYTNPIKNLQTVSATLESKFCLTDIISNNVNIRNQMNTNYCWAITALSTLETNLALRNYLEGRDTSKVYDFSERHMNYTTTRIFLNNEINEIGFGRTPANGGNFYIAQTYLTNGSGAILESDMPFENNNNLIDISQIQNKEIQTQVYDTRVFPNYHINEVTEELRNDMKNHIKKYGAIYATSYSDQYYSNYYNRETAALYCNDITKIVKDHTLAIVGWDDNFSKENFNQNCRPNNDGAWIVMNSWGTDVLYHGFMFVSYEDVALYETMNGTIKADDKINYDNIYQYDYYGVGFMLNFKTNKMYLASVFNKSTNKKEFVNQISLYAPEAYSIKVYINTKNSEKSKENWQPVELKEDSVKIVDAGYHTLEFLNPVEITGDEFVIIVEVEGTRDNHISIGTEGKLEHEFYKYVKTEKDKCFYSIDGNVENNIWEDFGKLSEQAGGYPVDYDLTIKAFTISEAEDTSLKSIAITKEPDKTKYLVGENFDKKGMVVTATYNNGETKEVTDYTIEKGENLKKDQNSVTIRYQSMTAEQPITVEETENPPEEPSKDPEAENSIFTYMKSNVKNTKLYTFTDKTQKTYITMDIELTDIIKNTKNDKMEYYYYLSSSRNEKNINNWVKVKEEQYTSSPKLEFTIDTRDIANLNEVSTSDKLYLYIKEIATRGSSKKEAVPQAVELQSDKDAEIYKDGKKQITTDDQNKNDQQQNNNNNKDSNNTNTEKQNNNTNTNKQGYVNTSRQDNTVANKVLPKTGKTFLIVTIFTIAILGIVMYVKYEKIDK